MTHHSTVDSIINQVLERSQFDVADLFHRARHGGQRHVGVGGGVAVTREVLHRGYQAFTLHSHGVCHTFFANFFRILTKTAHPYDGVCRIGIDVDNRRKIHMDAHALALLGHLLTHLINQFIVVDSAQSHLVRVSDGVLEAHGQAPFRIDGDHKRRLGERLPRVGLFHLSRQIVAEKAHTTNIVLFDVLSNVLKIGFVGLVGTHANQLSHTLLHSETVIHRIHPARFRVLGKALCG